MLLKRKYKFQEIFDVLGSPANLQKFLPPLQVN